MGLSREPSLRSWMKWSSNNNHNSLASQQSKEPEIVHLGGSRIGSPILGTSTLGIPTLEIPKPSTPEHEASGLQAPSSSNFEVDERRLTAWPGFPAVASAAAPAAPATAASSAPGPMRSNTVAAISMSSRHTRKESREGPSRMSAAPLPLRNRSPHNTDSMGMLSPPASATAAYHTQTLAYKHPQQEYQTGDDRLPPSPKSASSDTSSVRPPAPLRTLRDGFQAPATPASSFSSPRTAPLQVQTDSFYFGDALTDDSPLTPGGTRSLHAKSPSFSGSFPTRSSSKGPNSKPKHLQRSLSAVDNNRRYKTAEPYANELSPGSVREEPSNPLQQWPLDSPTETIDSQPSPGEIVTGPPQVVVVDYPPPNSPPKRPLPKIVSIPPHGEKKPNSEPGSASSLPTTPGSARMPRHTTQQRLWLHKNYRGEAAFLKAWGLDIEQEEDRQEGKSILEDLMQAEDDSDAPHGLAAPLRQHQHSSSADWTNSSSTGSIEEAGLHVIQEEETASPPAQTNDKTAYHDRFPTAKKRGNGPPPSWARSNGHHGRSESETSVLGSYLETWIDKGER